MLALPYKENTHTETAAIFAIAIQASVNKTKNNKQVITRTEKARRGKYGKS